MNNSLKRNRKQKQKRNSNRVKGVGQRRGPATQTGGPNVLATLLHRPPIFAARSRRSGILYYESDLKLAHATGVKQDYFFTCNGLYDPNVTGTGHQPIGFDQMMLFFEHYVVVRAKMLVEFVNTNSDYPVRVGVYVSPDAVASTDHVKAMENGLIKTRIIDNDATAGGTGERIARMELDVDLPKILGKTTVEELLDDSELKGSATANPTEQSYFGVTMWGFPIGTVTEVIFSVTISYDAIFFEPRKLASS